MWTLVCLTNKSTFGFEIQCISLIDFGLHTGNNCVLLGQEFLVIFR